MTTTEVEPSKKEEEVDVVEEAEDMDAMTEDSNLADPSRRICIVTTAALPWMTGTAVNPLLRALYLTRGRPKDYVTLMIPWLEVAKERTKLYGPDRNFESSSDQEDWIRDFCRTRANCVEEEKNLRIQFYDSVYHPAFGSIFPLVDICGLVPAEEADIAILEEPEHLNWLRVPNESEVTKEDDEHHPHKLTKEQKRGRDKEQLGWTCKFRHVVGILHTNYDAYMKDYAIGTSIIAAPAIGMLSSTVVRAYCHQVIRLSAVLPSLAPNKEVTCNVHGVRSEFLDRGEPSSEASSEPFAAVYFIGKLIWAKGFDKVLDLQERYKTDTGEYFAMDIYGGGNDETAITRAFYGRKGKPPSEEEIENKMLAEQEAAKVLAETTEADIKAASVFSSQISLRRVISEPSHKAAEEQSFEVVKDAAGGDELDISESGVQAGAQVEESGPLEIIGDISTTSFFTGLSASQAVYSLGDSMVKAGLTMSFTEGPTTDDQESSDSSCVEADNIVAKGEPKKTKKKKEKKKKKKPFFFDPPQSRFEWRRYAIPARFLGVKDHAVVRDITEHKIFLNMSITEVLCTTTAEALAMGKFVIIPKHPSNTFFLQFPNCLAYETVEECVEKLKWALENEPIPLTDEYFHRFTWEGANERLFESAAITKKEAKHRVDSGQDKADLEVAWLHIETTKTGRIVHNFFALPSGATTPKG